jgi:uroporphyrinogen-III synthase
LPVPEFNGLRVLTLESRHSVEISRLIETYNGRPISAPAMREVPLSDNAPALDFTHELIAGAVDVVIFLTGVGARALLKVVEEEHRTEVFFQSLRRVKVVTRGPKPFSVLREWNVPVALTAPEPCTWRELVTCLGELPGGIHGRRVAVQEYGVSNVELLAALKERGAIVQSFAVYQWALPLDTAPLREAVNAVIERQVDVVLFTTGVQATHLFQIAEAMGQAEKLRAAMAGVMVASIGPATSEILDGFGIEVDLEPSHPKMGVLVKEAAERSGGFLQEKRAS